jgi:hypothetical protein
VLNAGTFAKATFTAGVGKVDASGTTTIGRVTEIAGAGTSSVRVRLVPGLALDGESLHLTASEADSSPPKWKAG